MRANPKIFWVTPQLRGRGVTVVVEEATHGVARIAGAYIGVVCLHSLPESYVETATIPAVCLDLPIEDRQASIDGFKQWMDREFPDVLIMNDVSSIEAYWPFIPRETRVIAVLHDHAFGWTKAAIEHAASLDAIVPVSKFVERAVAGKLRRFDGIFRTVENGTSYPVPPVRDIHRGRLRLVFLGAIDRQKGAFDLPAVLKECKKRKIEYSLTIIGGRSDELAAEFASADVRECVVWAGRLPRQQCFDALEKSDILLMLSRAEPFGLVTVEAMSMGCVPIGYSVGGTAEIVEDGKSGYLVPLCSFKRVADAIEQLDGDRPLLKSLSEESMRRSRACFSSASMAERYWKVIQDVIASPRQGIRLDPGTFRLPKLASRRYVRIVPAGLRAFVSRVIGLFPVVENYLRKFKGI